MDMDLQSHYTSSMFDFLILNIMLPIMINLIYDADFSSSAILVLFTTNLFLRLEPYFCPYVWN